MTDPMQHNCPHSDDGWCLDCVGELRRERDEAKSSTSDSLQRIANALEKIVDDGCLRVIVFRGYDDER